MDPAARYRKLRAETSSTLEKIGRFLADLCEGSSTPHDASAGPSLDSNLGSFYETFSSLQARHGDQNLTVAVLALTKSGAHLDVLLKVVSLPDGTSFMEGCYASVASFLHFQASLCSLVTGIAKSSIRAAQLCQPVSLSCKRPTKS